ncbi:MAG: hypothetical protein AAF989_01600 [Planctomycetota bacterium]
MSLSKDQIASLLGLVASAKEGCIDCDACFDHLAEFAEIELAGRDVPEALKAVDLHLKQCPCCKDEFEALMTGLRAMDEN